LCGDPNTPASALTAAFGNDPVGRLKELYQPRDATDTKAKDSMMSTLKDATGLRATVSTVRTEPAGTSCDWVMKVDFSYVSFVGGRRNPSWQMRVRLEMVGGSPQVKQVFGAIKQ
jgi:hypothetical protein